MGDKKDLESRIRSLSIPLLGVIRHGGLRELPAGWHQELHSLLLMFGSYSVINVIVLLNLLIAMMSNSYAMITEHSDVGWKFARTRLWMSYFDQSATLPPPFNIFPPLKLLLKMLGLRKKDQQAKEKD